MKWSTSDNVIYRSADISSIIPLLPPGVYQPINNHLVSKSADRFHFPYDVKYPRVDILQTVVTAWKGLTSNVGVLFNGTKGTGKTVTVQLLCNRMIDLGLPVIVVSAPDIIEGLMENIHQPCVVVFDEFEKVYSEMAKQNALLTEIDGMADKRQRRLFLFTTNTPDISPNFVDRPGRIRYTYNFDRLDDDTMLAFIHDMLPEHRRDWLDDILSYFDNLTTLTVDVVKSVLNEIIIFDEHPDEFDDRLGLQKQFHHGFTIELLDNEFKPVRVLQDRFKPSVRYTDSFKQLLKTTLATFDDTEIDRFINAYEDNAITFLEATEHKKVFKCHIKVPVHWYPYHKDSVWLDEMPENWTVPKWHKKRYDAVAGKPDFEAWESSDSLYGTGKPASVYLRFSLNRKPLTTSLKWSDLSLASAHHPSMEIK